MTPRNVECLQENQSLYRRWSRCLGFWSRSRSLGRFYGEKQQQLSLRPYELETNPFPKKGTLMSFGQSKSGCLHCRNYQGFCSALPSSVCWPCLQGRWRRQISGPIGVRFMRSFSRSGWIKRSDVFTPDSKVVLGRISQGLSTIDHALLFGEFLIWSYFPKGLKW